MSKLNIKKIAAVASAAAIMSSLTACGENTTWGADIDGAQIPAGVFIYYLQSAYYDAQSKISEEAAASAEDSLSDGGTAAETDMFSSQIEGKSAKDWIYDEATKSMQEYAAIEAKFDEYGLSLTSEEKESAQLYCDQLWDYGGEYYTEMGISQKSYLSLYLNNEKRNKLFEALYSEGGEFGVPDDEIKSYLDENYVMINYIEMELKDGEGNLLKSEGKAERMAMAEEYAERYKNGEDFDSLNAEYETYYKILQDEAAEKSAAESSAEVDESEAKAPLAGEGDTLLESEEDATSVTAVPDDAEADTDETAAEESAETESTEPAAEIAEKADTNADDSAADGESAAPAGAAANPEDTMVNAVESNKTVVERDSATPSAEVVNAAFDEMSKGEIKIIEAANGEYYYVVLKMDILETDEYFETAKDSLLYEMKSEDYDTLIAQWTGAQTVSKNTEAYDRYDPEKIFKED